MKIIMENMQINSTAKVVRTPLTLEYVKNHEEEIFGGIEFYHFLIEKAITYMDRWRCPLRMADNDLYWKMTEALSDFCMGNDFSCDDIDIEDVIL